MCYFQSQWPVKTTLVPRIPTKMLFSALGAGAGQIQENLQGIRKYQTGRRGVCLRWKDALAAFIALPQVFLSLSPVSAPILLGSALVPSPSCDLPGATSTASFPLGEGGSISLLGRSRGLST